MNRLLEYKGHTIEQNVKLNVSPRTKGGNPYHEIDTEVKYNGSTLLRCHNTSGTSSLSSTIVSEFKSAERFIDDKLSVKPEKQILLDMGFKD